MNKAGIYAFVTLSIGLISSILNWFYISFFVTFYLMVFDSRESAIPENAEILLTCFFANSLHNFYKLLKGESNTTPPIS
jgi:hypothetical protein